MCISGFKSEHTNDFYACRSDKWELQTPFQNQCFQPERFVHYFKTSQTTFDHMLKLTEESIRKFFSFCGCILLKRDWLNVKVRKWLRDKQWKSVQCVHTSRLASSKIRMLYNVSQSHIYGWYIVSHVMKILEHFPPCTYYIYTHVL